MTVTKNVPAEQQGQKNKNRLEIFSLGRFQVRRGEQLFTEDAGKSHQLWKLFKYLLTYCDRANHPELIMEALYPVEELKDPDRTLRNLVYRLRRLLATGTPSGFDQQYIVLSQKLYSLNLAANCWLDAEEFRNLLIKAGHTAPEDPQEAIVLYQKALSLYQGKYLPDNMYDDWVTPRRDYYHRLYLEAVGELIMLLKETGRYPELRNVCEKAFLNEPFLETLHLHYIEALLEEGKTSLAKTHYNDASSLLYRETGLKPSAKMFALYKRITGEKQGQGKKRLQQSEKPVLEWRGGEEAFCCNPERFFDFFKLEEVGPAENEKSLFWGCLTVTHTGERAPTLKKIEEAMLLLKRILWKNLRKGDLVCRWDNRKYCLLLKCPTQEDACKALERIKDCFLSFQVPCEISLQYTTGPLTTGGARPCWLKKPAVK